MPGEDAIKVVGTVAETLPNTLFRLVLPNGHRILAHAPARLKPRLSGVMPGDKLTVQMSPYDMSTGRIIFTES